MTSFLDTSRPLAGRTAIVTGSGRNLGRGIALGLARAGANVVLNGHRDEAALKKVAAEVEEAGSQALTYLADVSKPDQVQAMVDATIKRFGGVDIAVSNVGLRMRQAFLDISVEDWHQVIDTNLSAAFYLAKAAIPSMKVRGYGRIIHISGRDGFFTISHRAHNVTCKAGLHSLAKAIALEFGEFGITANTIAPGKMDTERDEKHYPGYKEEWAEHVKKMPLRRLGLPDDVAEACLYMCCGGNYVTGQLLHLNGGDSMY
ncbi:MAG: SDR family oxidoreductase [Pseudomonadota bacterium]